MNRFSKNENSQFFFIICILTRKRVVSLYGSYFNYFAKWSFDRRVPLLYLIYLHYNKYDEIISKLFISFSSQVYIV